jgi:hypothetical protein
VLGRENCEECNLCSGGCSMIVLLCLCMMGNLSLSLNVAILFSREAIAFVIWLILLLSAITCCAMSFIAFSII